MNLNQFMGALAKVNEEFRQSMVDAREAHQNNTARVFAQFNGEDQEEAGSYSEPHDWKRL